MIGPKTLRLGVLGWVVLVALGAGRVRAERCYSLDVRAGTWHATQAPEGYSFPQFVEQFRIGRPAIVWEAASGLPIEHERRAGGWISAITLPLPEGERDFVRIRVWPAMESIEFTAFCRFDSYNLRHKLLEDVRAQGTFLEIDLMGQRCPKLEVELHAQFARPPRVEKVWMGRLKNVTRTLVPEMLRSESYLFFRSPHAEEPLELCQGTGSNFQVFDLPEAMDPEVLKLGEPHRPRGWLARRIMGVIVLAGMLGLAFLLYLILARSPARG